MTALRKTAAVQAVKTVKTKSIGVVLEQLRAEFPDVTHSKIRFLETEGLIAPQRSSAGYRRFTEEDIERLRYILVTQRDDYLPLKVIREQLEAMDSGAVTSIMRANRATPMISPDNFRAPGDTRFSIEDVAAQAGVETERVEQLLRIGLVKPDVSGYFTVDDVRVVQTAVALSEFGFDERHLKSLRTAAGRQAGLIGQVAAPIARSQGGDSRQRAEELSQQMTALVVSLHASLVKSALREELG
ncbi:MerR family transcriptional regulator [Corynebacterium canis]|uniref:MerR family transcriptional regulator n=1 Tax=Corynebacterium canis TaxID=679663 RepID=A0A5C5UTW2_9CORY|nr:MerR family transcriptional regulator [Corynebacterium canis]TWT28983.1 MerR family transcriptional regulator [Corynebacterium canis]WJY75206.1 zinc-responsive transcriptional regulator [Corynebacterium canis]